MELKDITWDQDSLDSIIELGAKPLQAYAKILEDQVNNYFYDTEDQDKTNTLFTIIYDIERVGEELEETLDRLNDEQHSKIKVFKVNKGSNKAGLGEINWEYETSRAVSILTNQFEDSSTEVISLLRDHFQDLYNQIIA